MSRQAKINFELLEQMIADELFHIVEDEIKRLLEEELETYDQMRLEELLVRVLRVKAENQLALNYNLCAYIKAKQLNDIDYLAKISFHSISLFSKLDYQEQALYYGEKALAYYKQLENNEKIAHVYNALGAVYGDSNELEHAQYYFEQALSFESDLNLKTKLTTCLNISMINILKKDYNKALELIETYSPQVHELHNIRILIFMYRIKGIAYYGLKHYGQLRDNFEFVKQYQAYIKDFHEQIDCYELLSKIADEYGNTEHQIQFEKRILELKSQLKNEQN